jgi:hypothetical protein
VTRIAKILPFPWKNFEKTLKNSKQVRQSIIGFFCPASQIAALNDWLLKTLQAITTLLWQ